nr:phosphopantetheine-binding protein [Bacillus sp. E(2018)]
MILIEDILYNLLFTKFKVDSALINKKDSLKDLGIDSLEMVVLVLELEQIIGRSISDQEMINLETVEDVIQILSKNIQLEKGMNHYAYNKK